MSVDVEKVLKDYVSVIDQKDAEHFRLASRCSELEELLGHCRAKLLALTAEVDEKDSHISALSSRVTADEQAISSMDDELIRLRTFVRSIRKCLVVDDNTRFSLGDVLHVLCSRLEDYGTVAHAYQRLREYTKESESHCQRMLQANEEAARNSFAYLSSECEKTIAEMLTLSNQMVRTTAFERADLKEKMQLREEMIDSEKRRMNETLIPQLDTLKNNVDRLMTENEELRQERNASVCRNSQLEKQLRRNEGLFSATLSLFNRLMEMERGLWQSELSDQWDHVRFVQRAFNQASTRAAMEHSEKTTLQQVNVELRKQIAALSKRLDALQTTRESERDRATHSAEVAGARTHAHVAEIRQKLSDSIGRENAMSDKLRETTAALYSYRERCAEAESAAERSTAQLAAAEKRCRQLTQEKSELKQLLSGLQTRSAQMRDLLQESEQKADLCAKEASCATRQLDAVSKSLTEISAKLTAVESSKVALEKEFSEFRSLTSRDKEQMQLGLEQAILVEVAKARDTASREAQQTLLDRQSVESELHGAIDALQSQLRHKESECVVLLNRNNALKQQYDIEIELLNAVLAKERNQFAQSQQQPNMSFAAAERRQSGSNISELMHSPPKEGQLQSPGVNEVSNVSVASAGSEHFPVDPSVENMKLRTQLAQWQKACELSVRQVADLREQMFRLKS